MRPLLIVLLLTLAGCSMLPNSIRYLGRGTPEERALAQSKKTDAALATAAGAVLGDIDRSLFAIREPFSERRDEVITAFLQDGHNLIAKSHPSTPESDAKNADLVERLLSENKEIQKKADDDWNRQAKANAAIVNQLSAEQAKSAKLALQVKEQIAETEWWAGWAKKAAWTLVAIAALYFGGTVLSILARFFPAFAVASTAINTIAAPAVQFAFRRAKSGLEKVGAAITDVRKVMPEAAEKVTAIFDGHLDTDHKAIVKPAADAAVPP